MLDIFVVLLCCDDVVLEFFGNCCLCFVKILMVLVLLWDEVIDLLILVVCMLDYGVFVFWCFIVLNDEVLNIYVDVLQFVGECLGVEQVNIDKLVMIYCVLFLVVVVVVLFKFVVKVFEIEQLYLVGVVCLSFVNVVLVSGWGVLWVLGWYSYDLQFLLEQLGIVGYEKVVGIVYIGIVMMLLFQCLWFDIVMIIEWWDV